MKNKLRLNYKDLDKDGYYGIQIIGGNCIMKIAKDKDFIIYSMRISNGVPVSEIQIEYMLLQSQPIWSKMFGLS